MPEPSGIGADIGHVHLKVANLERSVAFYRLLGFEQRKAMDGAVFLAFDGYHHHLAPQYMGEQGWPAAGANFNRPIPLRSSLPISATSGQCRSLGHRGRDRDRLDVRLWWHRRFGLHPRPGRQRRRAHMGSSVGATSDAVAGNRSGTGCRRAVPRRRCVRLNGFEAPAVGALI